MQRTTDNDNLSDDLLNGANAIADFLGWPVNKVYYAASRGQLPIRKIGPKAIIGSRARLRSFFQGQVEPEEPRPEQEPAALRPSQRNGR
jgi:hypothetical protein